MSGLGSLLGDFTSTANLGGDAAAGGYGPTFGNVTVGNPVGNMQWAIVAVAVVAVAFVVWGRK